MPEVSVVRNFDEGLASWANQPPAPRQCGRCRLVFPGDPDLFPGAIPDWWVCAPCRPILLPTPRNAVGP